MSRRKNFKNRSQSYDPQNNRYVKFGNGHKIMNVKHDYKPFKRIHKNKKGQQEMEITKLKNNVNSIYHICTASTEEVITSGDKIKPYNDLVNSGCNNIKMLKEKWPGIRKEVNDILNEAVGVTANEKKILNKDIKNVDNLLNK